MANPTIASADWFRTLLLDPEATRLWLGGLGVRDTDRGFRDLQDLARRVGRLHLLPRIAAQFHSLLPRCPDPGMALTNLDRFVSACPDPGETLGLLSQSERTTEILLQLFSTSQHLTEMMIRDSSMLDWLRRGPERRDREALVDDLWSSLRDLKDENDQRLALRQFRFRELLRIGYNDIVRTLPLELITLDLSVLADACVEAACRMARQRIVAKHGEPLRADGRPTGFVVLALGKLGGLELNYSSDIDLIFLYESEGQTDGSKSVSNSEFFARMGGEIVRLLADHTALGMAYRVDMRLRPEGDQGALARSLAATLGYYETSGRTWERQAMIKCRPIAGDLRLGATFLNAITPFVYRRYLSSTEIGEIKAMKRRIEQRTLSAGTAEIEVKTGHGGIRDVEFVVQFLQLLHGGAYPEVRHGNTLSAMARLESVGCLTPDERGIMEDTYRFLRRVEHRLQIMFDRQTHEMPRKLEDQRILAVRMGYPPASAWEDRTGPAQRFLADYRSKTDLNRRILNHLLHDAFRDEAGTTSDPVVDLVLDPAPSLEQIASVFANYSFRDSATAYQNLMALAREDIPFLSQARCQHFLAAIAPRLLETVSRAADPDMALTNLEKVSASLGAKAVLWELFSFNPPTLRLYVELCATSQFLSEILINNPGMIDDLMDSLVVDRAQTTKEIKAEAAELCRGAEDLSPILLSFRNKEWVRIGTRDILGREPIRDVTRELSDVAEAVVGAVARAEWKNRSSRLGVPRRASDGGRARWAIIALGKFGGRELNYHSDLDLVFILEEDGVTAGGEKSVSSEQFVGEVVRRVLRFLGGSTGATPIYSVDARLRPHGASGSLVVTLKSLEIYYLNDAQGWERLALTRARTIFATGGFGRVVDQTIHRVLMNAPMPTRTLAHEILMIRRKLEESFSKKDLKRGYGGLIDIEFLVHFLQLSRASEHPRILTPNLWDALEALRDSSLLDSEAYQDLIDAYEFWRTVESRLRMIHNRGGADLPENTDELVRLARRLNYYDPNPIECAEAFRADADRHTHRTRSLFEKIVGGAVFDSGPN